MTIKKSEFTRGIVLRADDIGVDGIEGEIKVGLTSKKLHVYLDGALRNVVTEAQVQTLSNKTLTSPVINTGVSGTAIDTDGTLAANSDTLLASQKAVKTYIDAGLAGQNQASEITIDAIPGLSATNVQDALEEIDTNVDTVTAGLAAHIADAVDAHDASAISNVPSGNLSATDQQGVNNELQGDIDTLNTGLAAEITNRTNDVNAEETRALAAEATLQTNINTEASTRASADTTLQTNIDAHINDATAAHAASAVSNTPSGNLSATNQQAANNELQGDIDTLNANKVTGPASSTDNAIARYDSTTGKLIQNSPVTLDDSGNLSSVAAVGNTGLTAGVTFTSNETNLFADTITHQGAVTYNSIQDNSSVGSDVVLDASGAKTIIVTNINLVSIGGFANGVLDQEITILNKAVAPLIIKNVASVAGLPIVTGTGGDIELPYEGAMTFIQDDLGSAYYAVGGVGTGTSTSGTADPDVLLVQTFDESVIGDFTVTGSGASLTTSNTINGDQSLLIEHQSGSSTTVKQASISVPMKYRGANMTGYAVIRSTASSGNVTLTVTDETNSATLQTLSLQTDSTSGTGDTSNGSALLTGMSSTVTAELEVGMSVTGPGIIAGTVLIAVGETFVTLSNNAISTNAAETYRFSALPKTLQFGFRIPADCESIAYTVTALPEADSPVTYIDDIKLANYWMGASNQGQSEILVPTITTQSMYFGAGPSTFGSTYTANRRFNSPTSTSGSGIIQFVDSATLGSYIEALEDCEVTVSYGGSYNSTTAPVYAVTINQTGASYSTGSFYIIEQFPVNSNVGMSGSFKLTTGDKLAIYATPTGFNVSSERMSVTATAVTTTTVTTNDLVPAKAVLGNSTFEVPVVTQQSEMLTNNTDPFSGTVTGTQSNQVGTGVFSYSAGTYTLLEDAEVNISAYCSAATVSGATMSIFVNGVLQSSAITPGADSSAVSASYTGLLSAGDTFYTSIVAGSTDSVIVNISATAVTTEEVTISGTQQLVTDEDDSMIRLDTANGYGSTGTKIRRFTNIRSNLGSDIVYSDSATNGASFTVQTDGVYSITYVDNFSGASTLGISKNASSLSTNIESLTISEVLASTSSSGANITEVASWTGYLVEGDIIRPHTNGSAAGTSPVLFTIVKQNAAKVVQTIADQKIEIPTSELRFEGASARGAVATAIVKFDTLAKIRGDAFTVTNTTNDGTYVTMTKKGKLSTTANLRFAGATLYNITKNQSVLTSIGAASEVLSQTNANSSYESISWTGDVEIGDIIRVAAGAASTADTSNSLILSFQEQSIAVSVSNTLPQFSESDSSLILNTVNGYGSTNTKIRRFSNLTQNIGTDIVYTDSATDGASFTVQTAGIYNISYTDTFSAASSFGISKNSSALTTNITSLTSSEVLAFGYVDTANGLGNTSCQVFLNEGDIIRPHANAVTNGTTPGWGRFSISKVGKPNVTGVDVTPFIEIPQPQTQYMFCGGGTTRGSSTTAVIYTVTTNSGDNIIVHTSDSTNGSRFTALERCVLNFNTGVSGPAGTSTAEIYNSRGEQLNRVEWNVTSDSVNYMDLSANVILNAGEYLYVTSGANLLSATVTLTATANSDQIVTPIESFSTDTASLTYASSSQYTLSTLANAPVGTFITFTYAASTNTRTQTTTAPTQTTADMNTNGIQLFARAYNAASTAAQPAAIAIQIGKGLKSCELTLFKDTTKTVTGNFPLYTANTTATIQYGFSYNDYNSSTGILTLDAAVKGPAVTASGFQFSDISTATSGYLVINASKNPALCGLGLNRVAARYTSDAGQSVPVADTIMKFEDLDFDTHGAYNTTTGLYTVPETGYYQVSASLIKSAATSLATNQAFIVRLFVNGTAKTESRTYGGGVGAAHNTAVSQVLYLAKGATVGVYTACSVATTLDTTANYNVFSIVKVSI